MKFTRLIPLLLLGIPGVPLAQTVIEYDVLKVTTKQGLSPDGKTEKSISGLTSTITSNSKVTNGQFVVLKISNVNTFRYKVEIKGVGIDYITPVPSELQALFRLGEVDEAEDEKKTKEAADGAQDATGDVQKVKTEASNKTKDQETIVTNITAEIAKAEKELSSRTTELRTLESTPSRTRAQLTTAKTSVTTASDKVAQLKEQAEDAKVERTTLENFEAAMTALLNAAKSYSDKAGEVANITVIRSQLIDISKTAITYDVMSTQFEALKVNITKMQTDLRKFNELYSNVEAEYLNAMNAANATSEAATNLKRVKEAYDKIEKSYKALKAEDYLLLIKDISTLSLAMSNADTFTVFSPPVQMDGHLVRFEVSIQPVPVGDLMNNVSGKTFRFDVPTKGGFKADFSVGPALSFGENAFDHKYYIKKEPDDTTGKLVKSTNSSDVFPAVAAMMHAYPRLGPEFNAGVMMGVGAGFKPNETLNASYYFGLSLVLGKRQKIILSGGVSFLPVARLKNIYDETTTITLSEFNIDDVTEDVIKKSGFFSLSYNLTNRVEVK